MSVSSFAEAVRAIGVTTGGPTPELRSLAKHLGLRIRRNTPRLVVAAQLRFALSPLLDLEVRPGPTREQIEYLAKVAEGVGVCVPDLNGLARDEHEAWLAHCYLLRRSRALTSLRLEAGDLVFVDGDARAVECVSSIGSDGSVYFKGRGARAWPDRLVVAARASDVDPPAADLRRQAENRAALRARTDRWSAAKQSHLAPFEVPNDATDAQLRGLQDVVDAAVDEKPIQTYLAANREILASLLRGPHRFVMPQVRVGTRYVADFFLAEVDSLGVRWTLVELETPRSSVVLKSSNDFERSARKGISQVKEWREWLQSELAQARRPVVESGLGLIDIRPSADGLVLVGSSSRLSSPSSDLRSALWEDSRIRVHTYDWLIGTVEAALGYRGPPGANPHLLVNRDLGGRGL